MSKMFAYRCKFCGATGAAECDEQCPELKIEAWLPLLCCDRCGDYQEWLRTVLQRIAQWSRDWSLKSEKARTENRIETRRKLESFTQKLAAKMCDHYRVDYTWTDDFVGELLAHPEVSQTIVRAYERGLKRLAAKGFAGYEGSAEDLAPAER